MVLTNFWSQAKRHLRKFNGDPYGVSYLLGYISKEGEWRFNPPLSPARYNLKMLRDDAYLEND